jgi:hypothetical protein
MIRDTVCNNYRRAKPQSMEWCTLCKKNGRAEHHNIEGTRDRACCYCLWELVKPAILQQYPSGQSLVQPRQIAAQEDPHSDQVADSADEAELDHPSSRRTTGGNIQPRRTSGEAYPIDSVQLVISSQFLITALRGNLQSSRTTWLIWTVSPLVTGTLPNLLQVLMHKLIHHIRTHMATVVALIKDNPLQLLHRFKRHHTLGETRKLNGSMNN